MQGGGTGCLFTSSISWSQKWWLETWQGHFHTTPMKANIALWPFPIPSPSSTQESSVDTRSKSTIASWLKTPCVEFNYMWPREGSEENTGLWISVTWSPEHCKIWLWRCRKLEQLSTLVLFVTLNHWIVFDYAPLGMVASPRSGSSNILQISKDDTQRADGHLMLEKGWKDGCVPRATNPQLVTNTVSEV